MIDIYRLAKEKTPMIDRELDKIMPKTGIENLHDAVWYHTETGGKRLRPLLAIMTCEALGNNDSDSALVVLAV